MVLTAEQMRIVEARSVELGMNWLRLMENAGSAAAHIIRENYALDSKKVVIVCGKGNNGGDGYVIARKFIENNAQLRVISVGTPSTPSANEMLSKAFQLNIRPIDFESYQELCCQYIENADIVIDAVFGIGFKGEPSGVYKTVIESINRSFGQRIAIDVPSGMCSDGGAVSSCCVRADLTVTFGAYKPCHLLYPTTELCGKVVVASIGMPDAAFDGVEPIMQVVEESAVAAALPVRSIGAHKGDSGTAGLLCGAKGYAGAAVLAGKAAVKSGAGIVNMIIPDEIYNIVGTSLPEAVCTVLDNTPSGDVSTVVTERVINTLDGCTAGLIGCGLGQSNQAKHTVHEIMKNCSIPLVLDADGINILSDSIECIRKYTNDVVITPHPKEASRLLKISVEDIQNDRLAAAKALAEKTNAVSVLKGAKTIIALPDGAVYIVTDGNPGMATAGTGDMLAGMIVAFMAQGMSAADSAISAVKIHALSGDIAVRETSVLSLTPSDMINTLPTVYCRLYSKK